MFRLLALVLAFAALNALSVNAQEFGIPSVTISGGDLPHSVELSPTDADAFRRRVNQLPRFEDPPAVAGPRYVVTTSYWPAAVRLDEDEGEDVLDVDVRGDYYPLGGFVRVTVEGDGKEDGEGPDDGEGSGDGENEDGSEDAWMALNLRQRAILDRYIRLSNQGLLADAPSSIEVLAASSPTEQFGVQAGDNVIAPETAAQLLTRLSKANPAPILDEREPPAGDGDGFWLIVTLLEGRSLRYYYSDGTFTEALGTERYDATSLGDLIETIAPGQPTPIDQEEPAGSLLWWPVSIGGGAVAIGAAIWLRRRSAS